MRLATERGRETGHRGTDPGRAVPRSRFALPFFQRVGGIVRTVFGMPDYDRYLEHRRACHPDTPVLSPSEFYAEHLKRRYESGGPTRCC